MHRGMAKNVGTFLISSLFIGLALSVRRSHALEYSVNNTAMGTQGGDRFSADIGDLYSLQTMDAATSFIWRLFQQESNPADRKDVQRVALFVEDADGIAFSVNNEIHFSARYIGGYNGDVKTMFTGVMYHEMTHVWQWNGKGAAPGGLIEGIADYVRLKSGFGSDQWVQPGGGDRWDQGYDVTARFLDYCNGLRDGFVSELNKKMRDGYSDGYFVDLLGKSVDQLWADYKALYGQS